VYVAAEVAVGEKAGAARDLDRLSSVEFATIGLAISATPAMEPPAKPALHCRQRHRLVIANQLGLLARWNGIGLIASLLVAVPTATSRPSWLAITSR